MKMLQRFPVTCFCLFIIVIVYFSIKWGEVDPRPFMFQPGVLGRSTFTWNFVHLDQTHILFNAIACLQLGSLMEIQLRSSRFAILTAILCLLVSLAAFYWIEYPLVGFSGILMAWVGLGLVLLWNIKPLRQMLLVWAVLNVLIGLVPGISFLGHVLGLVVGLVVGFLFQILRKTWQVIEN